MLVLDNIHTYYGQAKVLDGLGLRVERGECVALLGRNGAGKSTTMKSIVGSVPARKGSIVFNEDNITKEQSYKIIQRGVGYVPEDRRIFPDLTVHENIMVGQKGTISPDQAPWDIERIYTLFPKLEELKDREGGYLSGGEQQMLTVARTLMGNPALLLLDEPTEGLAPVIVQNMIEAMTVLKQEGLSLLISEQNQEAIRSICDRVYILEKGQIVFEGTMKEFDAADDIKAKHLSMN